MITINCQACNTPLTGGLDTYGPPGGELCQPCYWGMADEYKEQRRLHRIELEAKLKDYEAETEELERMGDDEMLVQINRARIKQLLEALKAL